MPPKTCRDNATRDIRAASIDILHHRIVVPCMHQRFAKIQISRRPLSRVDQKLRVLPRRNVSHPNVGILLEGIQDIDRNQRKKVGLTSEQQLHLRGTLAHEFINHARNLVVFPAAPVIRILLEHDLLVPFPLTQMIRTRASCPTFVKPTGILSRRIR